MNFSSYHWQIQKSKWLIRLLTVGYVLGIAACILNALAWSFKFTLIAFVFLHGWRTLKKLNNESWQLDYDEENGWQLIESNTLRVINVLPSTVISRHFIFLHYLCDGKKFYRLILKDALVANINDFRQLIVTLKTY